MLAVDQRRPRPKPDQVKGLGTRMLPTGTEQRVRPLLSRLIPEAERVDATVPLTKVGLDTLAAAELTLATEEESLFMLDDDDLNLPNFESVKAIVTMIDRRLNL